MVDSINISPLSFKDYTISPYGGQDLKPLTTISEDGTTLSLIGNTWKKLALPYQITANTILEFDFKSTAQGDIHAIGFDNDNRISKNWAFRLYGTEAWGNNTFDNYQSLAGNWKHYQIPVGNFFVDNMLYLTFINDRDISKPTAESLFANLKVYERLETQEDNFVTDKDTPISILSSSLLSNDIGTSLQIIDVSNAINGQAVLDSNGTILFTPNSNFSGIAQFKYVVRDRDDKNSTSTVNLSVNSLNNLALAINNAPIANNEVITTDENIPIAISIASLLKNDSDIDNDPLNLVEVNNPINGKVELDNHGNVIFRPAANFSGTASFDYTVSDDRQGIAKTTVTVNVNRMRLSFKNLKIESYDPYQDGQSAVTILDNGYTLKIAGNGWKKIALPCKITANTILEFDFKSTYQGETHAIGFDTDNNNSPDRAFQLYGTQHPWGVGNFRNYQTSAGSWKHYRISVGQFFQGQMQYLTFINDQDTPNPKGEGLFSNIQIYEAVDANDDKFTIKEDTSTVISSSNLFANDKGVLLKVVNISNVTNGSAIIDNNGDVVFTPKANYYGKGGFTYTLSDSEGYKDSATVEMAIDAVNDVPIATNDTAITLVNAPLTLTSASLLANDRDHDDDPLRIDAVSQATHGSVKLNTDGTILFTPETNYQGQANFTYTVKDNKGNSAQATVSINVRTPYLGSNLAGLVDYSPEVPFIDAFRTARTWMPQTLGVWHTNEFKLLDLDANGWVKSLPAPEDAPQYTYVSTLLYNSLKGRYPGGKYVVLYDGEGTIKYSMNGAKDEAASRPGRDVINVTPGDGGILLSIMATDPKRTGNYIRNIRAVPAAYENTYATQIFNPTFFDKVQDFHSFRFMDWMSTNNSTQKNWSDRPTFNSATWSAKGAPVEILVEFANRTDADPWFTMPHLATDEYVRNFAQYVKDHIESDRKVYVEYSNEVWNSQFEQFKWATQQGQLAENDNMGSYNYYSKRTTEITRIWDNVFAGQKERVIGVMAGQASNPWVAQKALNYDWSDRTKTHADYGIDAIAIAPYFGLGANKQKEAEIQSWTTQPDGGLNKLFDEITEGGVLSNGFSGGALAESYRNMQAHVNLAKRENLQILAYEGGQHLVGTGGVENNQAITNLFIQANRDPRMGDIYREYFTRWYQLGGGLFMNFSDVYNPNKWGSWGLLESIYDKGSPKYNAVMDVLHNRAN